MPSRPGLRGPHEEHEAPSVRQEVRHAMREVALRDSGTVTGTGVPPSIRTRCSPPWPGSGNRITPSSPHAPAWPNAASQIARGSPPLIASAFSRPSAKNATWRLSGLQNG